MRLAPILAVPLLVLAAGCHRSDDSANAATGADNLLEERDARLKEALAAPDTSGGVGDTPIARWLLPADLAEISGLALTPDGRLFAHNDETARISEVDYRKGVITKFFVVGEKSLHADFEGLTFANNRFWMLASNGVIYEFPEGEDRQRVDVTVHDTRLGKECEFEGIAWDPGTSSFILSCKNVREGKKDDLVLYRYRPSHDGRDDVSEVRVPQADLRGEHHWKRLHPTGIAVDPSTGNYVMVDAQEHVLFAVTPDGKPVLARRLHGDHPQPEGIEITGDHILIVSDEATSSAASITLYRWPGARSE